ncbi:MAG: HAD-IIIA family hydrolase [Candidatus Omnitrophica bacterium]|nr:HAD-IIIA family hydrolase [Candidatus Omnitrophota bacterium]
MKIIFLDRDGVINKDPAGWTKHSYVTCPGDFHFLPGAKEAIKKLTDAGYEIIVLSNQAGISRGYYNTEALKAINEKMLKEITASGGRIRSTHYCHHKTDDGCNCRKPKTGLFEMATKAMKLDFNETFFIGDGSMDVEAGKKVGCKTILLLCGKSKLEDVKAWKYKPDYIKKDLSEAVDWLLEGEGKDA